MKKIVLLALMVLPLLAGAQTKIKETAVPRSVLLALEKTYDSYKVRTWYQAPGQYIAEVVIDGQNGRAYFTAGGDWQYSTFPVKAEECPTLMNTYFVNNYPGYRIKSIDFIEVQHLVGVAPKVFVVVPALVTGYPVLCSPISRKTNPQVVVVVAEHIVFLPVQLLRHCHSRLNHAEEPHSHQNAFEECFHKERIILSAKVRFTSKTTIAICGK